MWQNLKFGNRNLWGTYSRIWVTDIPTHEMIKRTLNSTLTSEYKRGHLVELSLQRILAHLSLWLSGERASVFYLSVVCQQFSNVSASEVTGPIEVKFHMGLPMDVGTKICSWGPGHWPKWPPCPYLVKTLQNPFLLNQWGHCLETWHGNSSPP